MTIMKTDNMNLIRAYDKHHTSHYKKPSYSVEPKGFDGQLSIVRATNPDEIYYKINWDKDRIATLEEVIELRLKDFHNLIEKTGLKFQLNASLIEKISQIESDIYLWRDKYDRSSIEIGDIWKWRVFDSKTRFAKELLESSTSEYGLWKARLTTSTTMVRGRASDGEDSIFFYNGNPFESFEELTAAMKGILSDGGIKYDAKAMDKIRKDYYSKLSFKDYLGAKGGNFTGEQLLNHPIFSAAIPNQELRERYVIALQVLDRITFYNQGMFSLWRPGEMKMGFGRSIALGYKGEAFYPPNNDTVDHAALVLKK